LNRQVLSKQALGAWVRYLRGHASLTRELNAELVGRHGLTINEHEVLLRLSRAGDRRMRRVDLADSLLLTPSGITRLLDGLERREYVERASCKSDRRVVYAVLTDDGLHALRSASDDHVAGVDRLFARHFDEDELEQLSELLGRLSGGGDGDECDPPRG
jgi:DNA-binding MarR family transcriptional regulator